ncbi:MAG: HAMP domain-containing sensor histidine kinase [Polyangiaceae bacterium]
MHLGLRPQLLLLVSLLLGLAFVPLLWTTMTFTRVAMERTEHAAALQLGRSIGHAVADGQLAPKLLSPMVGLHVESMQDGATVHLGLPRPGVTEWTRFEQGVRDETSGKLLIWSGSRGNTGTAYVGVGIESRRAERHSFLGLLALYSGLLWVAVLLAIYVALTFLIVRPLDALGRVARRTTLGARAFEVPRLPARELESLAQSFHVMTERLLAEEAALKARIAEVKSSHERLEEAQERLLRAERLASVGRLAAGLSHELGNPIAAMMGLIDLLVQGGLSPDEERDFLKRLQRETERIHRILRDLLDFARPTSPSSAKLEEEPCTIDSALQETLSLVRPQKGFRGLDIDVDASVDLPQVTLSRSKLVQVLLNLLLNAADAMGGSGKITIRAFRLDEKQIELSVSDDGPGVPTNVRSRLFEPFATTKEVGKGTGLGLAVCRGLVEAAGGRIDLDDQYVPGARFRILLPASPVD